jgi:hypothetical protein
VTFGQSFARSRDSRFFPSKPGISSILPTQPSLAPKRMRQINRCEPIPVAAQNGNSRRPNRELDAPNRELPGLTAKIILSKSHKIDRSEGAIVPRNLVFYRADQPHDCGGSIRLLIDREVPPTRRAPDANGDDREVVELHPLILAVPTGERLRPDNEFLGMRPAWSTAILIAKFTPLHFAILSVNPHWTSQPCL